MSEELRLEYQRKGFLHAVGFGEVPALLVVDFSLGFTDPTCPLGANFASELAQTCRLLERFRARELPIVFTTVAYDPEDLERLRFIAKIPSLRLLEKSLGYWQLNPVLGRLESEKLIVKKQPSAFFETDLLEWLRSRGVDTLILCGVTTSGCIRASVIDALQNNYRVIIPRECVGDRAIGPHQANLLDMDSKYGDVLDLEGVLQRF
jgi:maleamate amidohydrolase